MWGYVFGAPCMCSCMSCFQSVIRLCCLDDSFIDRFVNVITSSVGSLVCAQLTEDVNGETLFHYCLVKPVVNCMISEVNPLDFKGNYCATSTNTKLVHWPLMGGLLHLVQRGGAWASWVPPRPLLAVPNVTAHPSTASVLITVLVYDGPLLCSFNVAIKGLIA